MKKRNDISKDVLKQMVLIEGRKQRDVAKYFNVSEACISKKLKEFELRKKPEDRYIGKVFGQLVPIAIKKYDSSGHAILECVCDCGKSTVVIAHSLTSGNTKSCGCSSRKRGETHANYKGYKKLRKQYWNTILHGAANRGIEIQITIKEAWNQYEKQGGRCALTGDKIFFARTSKTGKNSTASLDRIDSSKGYLKDNIQWVHKKVNRMKWDLTQEDFIKICRKVAAYAPGTKAIEICKNED